MIKLIN